MQGNVHEFCLGAIFNVPGTLRNVEMMGGKMGSNCPKCCLSNFMKFGR